ncbi:MAG: FG-GAP repeat protein [Phycisphaerales bacterium]|nr:MAG: FG-GAP repeat protein [Phycisphaerales bacterium]
MFVKRLHHLFRQWGGGAALIVLGCTGAASGQCFIAEMLAFDGAGGDQFGDCVAVSGSVAAVGASRDDDLGTSCGAVYVFRYEDGAGEWYEEAKLRAADGAAYDLFGWSVDVQEDAAGGDVIVVGAYLDDDAGSKSGSAYVFRYQGGLWQQEAKLVAFDAASDDEFGYAVAISGDLIIVGSSRDDDGGSNAGAAYVFRFSGYDWSFEQKLIGSDCADQDRFGNAVDVCGDLILVGSQYDDDAGVNSGAAYVFRYDGASTWQEEGKLIASDGAPYDQFGQSVAVDGDLVLVGAYLDDSGASNAGSVYVFRFDGSVWWEEARLSADDAASDDQFGYAVAVQADDIDGDAALIGAPVGNGTQNDSGSAYLFRFDGVDWILESEISGPDSATGDQCGWSLDLADEWLFIGANKHDHSADNDGSVFLFQGLQACVDCNENGISDAVDIADGISEDCNENGIPDECEIDENSEAPGGPFYCTEDCDPDCNVNGIPDECDIADGISDDCNENGIPDECEGDCNENGVPDDCDIADGISEDCNQNDVPDECDIADATSNDCNENGLPDECEIDENSEAPGGPFYCTEDCDPDCNVNGIPDECDIADGIEEDCNDNGIPDSCDIANQTSQDLNGNGIPDECEDCNENGYPDFLDVYYGFSDDCNENGTPDECEIDENSEAPGGPFYCTEDCDPDCNVNGIPDECDINSGFSDDLNDNGVPDECDPDCNENGIPDFVDIDQGTSNDLNENGIPDECEDCNENEIPDDMDIGSETSEDCNENGIPDECEIDENSNAPGGPFYCTEDCDPDCNENGIPDECDIDGGSSYDLNENGVPDECDPDCNENGLPDFLDILYGYSEDLNDNGIPDECECPGDCHPDNGDGTYGNGTVDIEDLFAVIAHWSEPDWPWDVNSDGKVDLDDLFVVLAQWGPCDS